MGWRFQGGMDREGAAKNYLDLTEEEDKLINQKTGQIQCLRARRKGKKGNEYEMVYFGQDKDDALTETTWMAKDALMKLTWTDTDKKKTEYALGPAMEKLMMQVDERIAFEQSGIGMKKLSTLNIQKHLDQFNLESQFGTYSKMHALSGGQKVKVVLASAMWMEPHVLILDEPTNFLDRDSLGALATAIKNYAGGVIIISHQREFYSALCPEVCRSSTAAAPSPAPSGWTPRRRRARRPRRRRRRPSRSTPTRSSTPSATRSRRRRRPRRSPSRSSRRSRSRSRRCASRARRSTPTRRSRRPATPWSRHAAAVCHEWTDSERVCRAVVPH